MTAASRESGGAPKEASIAQRRSASVRQDQLVEIAIRFFAKKGYAGTSLREIADEARITKAALYYHFPTKEALYDRIVVNSMKALLESVTDAVNTASNGEEKVRRFMLASADFMDSSRDAWKASSHVFWSGEEAGPRNAAIDLRDGYERLLRQCIRAANDEGKFRNVDPSMAGRMLLSLLNQISRWHSLSGRLSTHEVINQYLDFALNGLRVHPVAE